MATEMKVWQVSKTGGLRAVDENLLEANHVECELEGWIAENPAILGDDLLVIDRQWQIDNDRRLDLLCIDSAGAFVIVELKRDETPREAVAQALDYASWFNDADELRIQEIQDRAQEYLKRPLNEAFTEHFEIPEMPELVGQNHRIIVAAPRLNSAAERIIKYLATRHGVQINAVFFKYARLSTAEEILVRSVLVEEVRSRPSRQGRPPTVGEVQKTGEERGVGALVETCRRMKSDWEERPAGVYGGKSLVYLAKVTDSANPGAVTAGLTVLGIDVSGQQMGAPPSQLDVWIPVPKLAAATALSEATIRETLETLRPPIDHQDLKIAAAKPPDWERWGAGRKAAWSKKQNTGENVWIRLCATAQAEALVRQLREWNSAGQSQAKGVPEPVICAQGT